MKITTTRRISQIFFFTLFIWLCVVTTIGQKLWQHRGWPVNFFLNLDPLGVIGTVLSTHKLYASLLWSLITIILTILFGRFFCGLVCPFGTLHQFVSHLAHGKKTSKLISLHKYHKAQRIKYYILIVFLIMAAFGGSSSLLSGLLDPIPLFTRSINLLILPIIGSSAKIVATNRFYQSSLLTLAVFLIFVLLNFYKPRFFCIYICPLGALFGLINRFAILRINRNLSKCTDCKLCDSHCQGSCEPAETVKLSECLLCFNCIDDCKFNAVDFSTAESETIQMSPDLSRRGLVAAAFTGLLTLPALRLFGASYKDSNLIRPPGAIPEKDFLKRCLKCGQCMRLCPSNVIQPAGLEAGLENLWTPVMNNRIGTSGCQLNCVACGYICPTAAIKPLTLAEKLGKGDFSDKGPVKIGTAFVDRSKCLPWAYGIPCLVCQENCPVSPKAIYTQPGDDKQNETAILRPYVDPQRCIGCGICQHECPVGSKGAIIVTPDGQSRENKFFL
ncbi:MAG: 4Fe-4S binding protein [Phycisphaerae bacterium]|jgi:polyferredoxin